MLRSFTPKISTCFLSNKSALSFSKILDRTYSPLRSLPNRASFLKSNATSTNRTATISTNQIFWKCSHQYSEKEQLDFRKNSSLELHSDAQQSESSTKQSSSTNCLMIHPVFYPNKGPQMELYLAEEAIGLIKSLEWDVQKGPYWQDEFDKKIIGENPAQEGEPADDSTSQKTMNVEENEEEEDETNEGDMFHEWRNKIMRESIAKSSLVKMKRTISKSFFTKGRVMDLGVFIRDNGVECVFLNCELTPTQHKTLEKLWTGIANGREDETFFKRVGESGSSGSYQESLDDFGESHYSSEFDRKIRVFDRFTMILQIFAKRASTQVAKHQIEICFLNYLKSKLQREGGSTFNAMYNIFQGDLMTAKEISLEVVSAKSRSAKGKVSGEGETQLELQRRLVNDKLAKLKRDLAGLLENQAFLRQKRKKTHNNVPTIALIGYTNAGKSALMNALIKKEVVESKDNLFQTLSTTSRKFKLVSGQQAILLDTIGFITGLPHELVDSFQSTLMEVENADLVLHVRDISHPHTEDQKKTVLQVLKDLKFDQAFYTNKMIEVWNKMDLLEDTVDYASALKQDYPIVPVSALYNTNIKKLTQIVEDKVNFLMKKKYYNIVNPLDQQSDRIAWLFSNANISRIENEVYSYLPTKKFPFGSVEFRVLLDEITYRRYCSTFGIATEQVSQAKGMPSKEWLKGSESYFEKKRKEKEIDDLNFIANERSNKGPTDKSQ